MISIIPVMATHAGRGLGESSAIRRGTPPRLALFFAIALGTLPSIVGEARGDQGSPATETVTATPSTPVSQPDSTAVAPIDSVTAVPQRDIMDVINRIIHGERIEPEMNVQFGKGLSWTILPTFSYNPVYGFALGASASAAGRRGEDPALRMSSLALGGNYSTTDQVQAYVRGDVFSRGGNYLLKGDVRYIDTNRSTWGLGPVVEGQSEYPMDFKQARAYMTLYLHIGGPVYGGVGYHLDNYFEIRDERAEAGQTTPYTEYSGGMLRNAVASGYSANLLGDTRDNPVNASKGYYLSMSIRDYTTDLGSLNNWQEMWTEFRVYPHLPASSRHTLAFWLYSWLTFGSPPYLSLPMTAGDTPGRGARGYLQGRIRGRNQLYLETEYRMQLTRDGLFGAVVFFNATGTTLPDEQTFGRTDKAGGLGLRAKMNKRSNTNLAVDAAWGEHSKVKWFFAATEVF